MDQTDLALSMHLLQNSRVSYRELADRLGLSVNAVHKRIQSLIEIGMIRGFRAHISLLALQAVQVLVSGPSQARSMESALEELTHSDQVYWVATGSGNQLYVGGYLRSLNGLDQFVTLVKRKGEVASPSVGIVSYSSMELAEHPELAQLDYEIIASLHRDARKPISEVAEEIGISAKTARRRLDAMVRDGLVELTIEWYPDASDDIVAIFDLELRPEVDKLIEMGLLSHRFSSNLLFFQIYANLPNAITGWMYSRTMKQMKAVCDQMEKAEGVVRSIPNIIYSGAVYDTWRDSLLLSKAQRTLQK
jgi:DNA-binding Lrp family transcriptional regulator